MRKVITFIVISLLMVFDNAFAKSNKRSRSNTRSSSSVVRARTTSSSSSSTSSSSNSSKALLSSVHRFMNDSGVFDTTLMYDKKYDLVNMFLPSVYSYYYSNGSAGINEKLCFGPYMQLSGINASGDYVVYKAEDSLVCQELLSGYTYTLELIEATTSLLDKVMTNRRINITRNDEIVNYMTFDYEPFIDISEYVPEVISAVNSAKISCSEFYNNMEDLKTKLGWSTGLSAGGLVLSAGATGVGVYNVIKTNDTISKVKKNKELESKYEFNEGTGRNILEKELKNAKDSKENKKNSILSKEGFEIEEGKTLTKADIIAKKEKSILKEFQEFNCIFGKNIGGLEVKEEQNEFYQPVVKVSGCKKIRDGFVEFKKGLDCSEMYDELVDDTYCVSRAKYYNLDLSNTENLKASVNAFLIEKGNQVNNDLLKLENLDDDTLLSEDLIGEDKKIKEAEEKLKSFDVYSNMQEKITNNRKTSTTLDWVQAGLNAGSLLTSGTSLAFSVGAIQVANKALESLATCQSDIKKLQVTYSQYKAEIQDYGEE